MLKILEAIAVVGMAVAVVLAFMVAAIAQIPGSFHHEHRWWVLAVLVAWIAGYASAEYVQMQKKR